MKTASMVMGIIGGALALLVAFIMILTGAAFFTISEHSSERLNIELDDWDAGFDNSLNDVEIYIEPSTVTDIAGGTIIFFAALSLFAGVLGLIGGIIARKRSLAAGVLMIIAAPLSLFGYFNIVSMILFILGAVFAFVKEKPQYAPASYPPYPPYPQYPQAPPYAPQPLAPTAETPAPQDEHKE